MCGIAGFVGEPDSTRALDCVTRMTAALARRGPDAEGVDSWPGAVLGHRRLSIFDLSAAGRQPMVSADRSVAIVFNGAIYNFPDLRRELEAAGRKFGTQTDTEVLIEGYLAWGIDRLLERIRGMFAFGLWDDRSKTLYLVRDRLGVKPLLWGRVGSGIAFASSARAFRLAGLAGELDPQAVAEFLEFGYVTDDRSIYQGFTKLPAATALEWREGRTRTWTYWETPPARPSGAIAFEDAVAETERLFLAAVKKRLFADVPIGALLSAGVDSSLVCWAIAELGGDITAYSIATPGDPFDESEDARLTAQQLAIPHKVLDAGAADSKAELAEQIEAYGEPFACASGMGMLKLSRAITASATVLLTGDGGDDVYLGYPEHRHLLWAQNVARKTPAPLAALWRAAGGAVPKVGPLRRAAHFLDYATGGLGSITRVHEGLPLYRSSGMLGERLKGADVAQRGIPPSLESARDMLTEFLVYDRRTRFVGEYMTKVDGATMHHALEARSPFLDTDLWDFAASLPYDLRLKDNTLKAVLRELVRRKIGDRIASGAKRGFGIPVARWIVGDWRSDVETTFRESVLDREGWLNGDATLRCLEGAVARGGAPLRLWYAYVLELWRRRDLADGK